METPGTLINREPSEWAVERAAVREMILSFEKRDPKAPWPVHPAFGRMTSAAWGVLAYRHTDRHFRQFGI